MEVSIFRSRFQPITKYHIDAIKWYFENQTEFSFPEYLVLCIIRDYDIVHQRYKLFTDMQPDDLRHLSMFNSLSSWDIRWILSKELPKEHLEKVIIIEIPLKFKELVEAIKNKGHIITNSLQRYFSYLKSQEQTCRKQSECKSLTINESSVGKWWALQAFDISPFPEAETVNWFFPIFDHEDYSDWITAKQEFSEGKTIILPMMNDFFYQPKTIPDAPTLGIYGIYIYYSYLLFKHLDSELEGIITAFPSSAFVTEYYLKNIKQWETNNAKTLSNVENEILSDANKFVNYCRSTLSIVSDPGYTSNIRKFFNEKFESKTNTSLQKQIANCTNWKRLTNGSENRAATTFENCLLHLQRKIKNGEITMQELKADSASLETMLSWNSV